MSAPVLPEKLAAFLEGFCFEAEKIGMSGAQVYRCTKGDTVYYLKIERICRESTTERDMLLWMQGKVPVPRVEQVLRQDGLQYLLTSCLPGRMACDKAFLKDPVGVAGLLAKGMQMLWQADISDCPVDQMPAAKLAGALENVQQGRVHMSEIEPESAAYGSPMGIYEELVRTVPPVERAVLSHGDYCLPNVFFADGQVTGYLDLGRAGVCDIWQDIALCVRSFRYNFRRCTEAERQAGVDALFEALGLQPDAEKLRFYLLLDELY